MRIVASFDKENLASRFSLFLEKEKIENTLEPIYDKKQKINVYNIWVHNEDDLPKAKEFYDEFSSNPTDSKYDVELKEILTEENKNEEPKIILERDVDPFVSKKMYPFKITFFFLILCIILFFVNYMQEINILKKYNFKELVLLTPIQRILLFDLPHDRVKLDQVIIKYNLDSEKKLENPPAQAKQAIKEIENEPSWVGLYDIILQKIQKTNTENKFPPLFEKIKKGEIWRLFSPVVLHSGILHILFNMLWLWYLGKLMEPRLGFIRYILFIIIVAIVSNTFQYLMGGPYFLGFSGVITGMIGYIYVRQKDAPWEGYNIPAAVFYFIWIFILAMLVLQFSSFILQIFKPKLGFTPGIANTAHIVGAIVGAILAKIPFFKVED